VALLAIGCGDNDNEAVLPTASPSPTATAVPPTAGPTATATALPSIAGEENLFGSTTQGGGALTINAVPLIPAYFSTCLGGSAADCTDGSRIYIGSDPGFKEADATEATATLFALPDGITVSLEVLTIDPALSLMFEAGTLNAAGQSLVLGTTPGIHADLEWQVVLSPGASFDAGHEVTLKLTTTASGFTDSVAFTETVQPSTGSPPEEPEE